MSDPEFLVETATSHIYAVRRDGEKAVLKLFTPIGVEDEYEGIAALRYFDGQGAVRVLAFDEGALLMEYAGDEQLAELVWRGEDEEATRIIAEVVNKLHQPRPGVPVPQFRTLRQRFRALFDRAARDEAAGENSIFVHGAHVAEHLLSTPREECVLHGDIQHHNIRRHPTRGWLAYDAKGLFGERTFDAANTLCNPSNVDVLVASEGRFLRNSQILAEGMGIPVARLRAYAFAYLCLSVSWWGDADNHEKKQVLKVAQNAEKHVDLSL